MKSRIVLFLLLLFLVDTADTSGTSDTSVTFRTSSRIRKPSVRILDDISDAMDVDEVVKNDSNAGNRAAKRYKEEDLNHQYKTSKRRVASIEAEMTKEVVVVEEEERVAVAIDEFEVGPINVARVACDKLFPLLKDYDAFVDEFFEATRELKEDEIESSLVRDGQSLLEAAYSSGELNVFNFLLDYGFKKTGLSGGRSMLLSSVMQKKHEYLDILLNYPQFRRQLCPSLILMANKHSPEMKEKLLAASDAFLKERESSSR